MRALHPDELKLQVIDEHTRGLADLATELNLATPIPTCGDWTLADLVWHVYEVQHFWLHIVARRPEGPESYVQPERPDDRLLTNSLRSTSKRLVTALDQADPDDTAWTWFDADQSIAFIVRRQIHEALVHRFDGTIAVNATPPQIEPRLAADGIDEMVHVMLSSTTTGGVVHLHTTDTDDRWTLSPTASGPQATERTSPQLVIEGSALALLMWLWGRELASSLMMTGELGLADQLRLRVIGQTQ